MKRNLQMQDLITENCFSLMDLHPVIVLLGVCVCEREREREGERERC